MRGNAGQAGAWGRGEGIPSRGVAGDVCEGILRGEGVCRARSRGLPERETGGYMGRSVAEDKGGVVYGGRAKATRRAGWRGL